MRVFYYAWYENSKPDMQMTLRQLGYDVISCHIPCCDYEHDENFCEKLEKLFAENMCDVFFSFDFFPVIAKVADKLKKQYLSWVYDCPHNTLYSPSVKSKYVSIFLFDKMQYYIMQSLKGENVYHLPLAVNEKRLNELLGTDLSNVPYKYDVSFVGSLYERNLYRQVVYLPDYLKGYIDGVVEAQQKIYGYNLIGDALAEKEFGELKKYIIMNWDAEYLMDSHQLYLDMLNAEVTHQERVGLLKAAAEHFDVRLFTGSTSDELPEYIYAGTVTYDKEMPRVFRESKINLNITLRSITSGIPLRALDIMGAGGFLLTNYQPEIAEYFEDGKEVVLFDSKEDMLDKIAYYLEHEDERKQIAYNGWKKVQNGFTYENQIRKIFSTIN